MGPNWIRCVTGIRVCDGQPEPQSDTSEEESNVGCVPFLSGELGDGPRYLPEGCTNDVFDQIGPIGRMAAHNATKAPTLGNFTHSDLVRSYFRNIAHILSWMDTMVRKLQIYGTQPNPVTESTHAWWH